jgi:tetratricopeptide (TPR) repeat protein
MLYGNFANAVIALGKLARGFELQATAREAAERFGLANELRWFRVEQILKDYWQGRWEAALDGADQFLAEVGAGSPHFMERTCRQVRGLIRLARGDLSGALADAARAVELAVQMGDPEALLPALAFHARALVATGQVQQAGARADELLTELAERGALATNPDWSGPLAIVLQVLERGAELVALAGAVAMPTPWLQAATAMAAGRFEEAADTYAEIGSLPDEMYARLRAAQQHVASGRRPEGTAQLQRTLAFYRQVAATAYLREGESLLVATA